MASQGPPGSLEQAFGQAAADYQRGDLKAAEKKLLKLQKQQPGMADVLHLLGLIALRADRPKKAKKWAGVIQVGALNAARARKARRGRLTKRNTVKQLSNSTVRTVKAKANTTPA